MPEHFGIQKAYVMVQRIKKIFNNISLGGDKKRLDCIKKKKRVNCKMSFC